MKQKKLLSLAIFLFFTLSQVFAQQKTRPINLKQGDWLETEIQLNTLTSNAIFNLRYEVSSKMSTGNIVFKVSFERLRLKYQDANNNWLGYDSYYPPYVENRRKSLVKQAYEIVTDNHGKILTSKLLVGAPKVKFSFITVRSTHIVKKMESTIESFLPTEHLKQLSETMISAAIDGKNLPEKSSFATAKGNAVANFVFKKASFNIAKNAVIKGTIINLAKTDSLYEFAGQLFKFNKNGAFNANVLTGLNDRSRWIFGQIDDFKTFTVFLEPYDTLVVKADAKNFDKTISFGGNAAAKAYLSKDLVAVVDKQWVNESNYRRKSLSEFLSFQQRGQKDFNDILNKYKGRVAPEILDYYRTEFKYVQAGTKLKYLSFQRSQPKPAFSIDDLPRDFFLSIDTLSTSMSSSNGGLYFTYYLTWLHAYQQTKLGMAKSGQYGFYADYATAIASFDGYPLYYSVYESLMKELHKSDLQNNERLKNYYEDFIHNCGDTTYTNRITALWTKERLWLPESPSPIKTLLLSDGSTLPLAKFKGKPLILIVNFNDPDFLKSYLDLIEKQKDKQVHFLVAQLRPSSFEKNTINETLKHLSNVTVVELSDKWGKEMNIDIYYRQTKVFTFDSDLKVISGYLLDENFDDGETVKPDYHEAIRELIQSAIDSNVMTKDQKASLLKTIGWSVCSVLFASIMFFLIYKTRINRIRNKTLLANKIKELEIKAIRSQMNPHFMFNALNSIQSLINNHQYNEANVYLEKFALLMRRVLNNSEKNFVALSDELEAIVLYCELEQLRFNFNFKIDVAPHVNTQLLEIPGMIIQPLVENSIVHGLAEKGDAGSLYIMITCGEKNLTITIKDNGTELNENVDKANKSFGLKLVRERLRLLSSDGNVGNLHLSSNLGENENGVTAVLTLPID